MSIDDSIKSEEQQLMKFIYMGEKIGMDAATTLQIYGNLIDYYDLSHMEEHRYPVNIEFYKQRTEFVNSLMYSFLSTRIQELEVKNE